MNETEVSILCAFTANVTGSSGAIGTVDFTSFAFPRVKLSGSSKDDGEKGLVMTMPFTALENIYGGAATNSQWTSIVIQDSKFT